MSDCIPHLSISHSPVFLLNSCLDLFSAPSLARRDPLSRSYRVNLPSSLTVNHSSALVYSTRLRVSVYGTGTIEVKFSGFSRQSDYPHYWIVPKDAPYYKVRISWWICLPRSTPTPFNRLFRQTAAVSLLRLHVTFNGSNGILTVSAIGLAVRLILRTRLTLIRLALIRKPESFGEGVSHPLYRYLYLHLLFHTLQNTSRYAFNAEWNAPLPIITDSTASVNSLIPDYYPRQIPRLVSCYALFK